MTADARSQEAAQKQQIGIVANCYFQCIGWVPLLVALFLIIVLIAELIFIDFMHGNPNRTTSDVIVMMLLFPPIIAVAAILGSLLVFALPMLFQAYVTIALVQFFGRRAHVGALLFIPIVAVLTWYCYDYLTPSDMNLGINAGPDWTPYKHGISMDRYLKTLLLLAPVSIFCVAYCHAALYSRRKRYILFSAVVVIFIAGVVTAHHRSEGQIELQHRKAFQEL